MLEKTLAIFKNLLKTALRNISKNYLYSFLNILGLSLGITSALFLIVYVSDELSYDKYHSIRDIHLYLYLGES